jgi:hypothetical protein
VTEESTLTFRSFAEFILRRFIDKGLRMTKEKVRMTKEKVRMTKEKVQEAEWKAKDNRAICFTC